MHDLDLDRVTREVLWRRVGELLEGHLEGLRDASIVPRGDAQTIAIGAPRDAVSLVEEAFRALEHGVVPVDHPRYFGLFNPAPATLAVVADAIVSGLNPQLATRSHAPWAVAEEDALVRELGVRFGWEREAASGAFTTGGGEANLTAVLAALHAAFPEVGARGVRAIAGEPRLYVSTEGHATIGRAARVAGLGAAAVHAIPSDAQGRMKPHALREALASDRAAGHLPFLVVATAGTTSSGAIDPIAEIAAIAERAGAWLHLDAAWGGLAALVPELRHALAGAERADSITFDPHKAMAAPMGTGTFLTRRAEVLARVFSDRSGYMPRDASSDPYAHALPWSRRFLGLRLLLPLAAVGWEGYTAALRVQLSMAEHLRAGLRARRWRVVNDTLLPVVCFVDELRDDGRFLDGVARATLASHGGWVSVPRLASGVRVLRACVNNHRTTEADVDRLLDALDRAREAA